MTLPQFLALLHRRALSTALVAFVCIACAASYVAVAPPSYRASASVFASVSGSSSVSDLSQGNAFSEARVASYTELATTPRILEAAARDIGLDRDVDELRRQVSATTSGDTVIVRITVTDDDPATAAALADAVTRELVAVVDEVERQDEGDALVQLRVVQPAIVPDDPVSPRLVVDLAVGLLLGLGLGIGQAVLRDVVDTRIRSLPSLRRATSSSIVAELPHDDATATAPLVDTTDRYSARAEAFRQLRTHLAFTKLDSGPQTVLVTSAVAGEGKSSTALNLAHVLAESGTRVALVDADLRRPTVGDKLGLESRVGLSTVLSQQVDLDDALQAVGSEGCLQVLTAGRVPPNPSELLSSARMAELLDDLGRRFDHVIVDAPPVLPVTDPAVLATRCSGVLLVVGLDGRAHTPEVVAALDALERVDARILGVVANKVRGPRRRQAYSYYGPTAPTSESPRRAARAGHGRRRPRAHG